MGGESTRRGPALKKKHAIHLNLELSFRDVEAAG
jgi:hypothetical protein